MSFLNNFKQHYHNKQIEDLINQNDFEGFFQYLKSLSNKDKLFYDLSLKHTSQIINKYSKDISDNKIVWLNSYLESDLEYVKNFFQFYFKEYSLLSQNIISYPEEISSLIYNEDIIDFNAFINYSYFFQWLILNKYNQKYKFILNNMPFFSTKNNFNFTKSNITQAYILIVNNPYNVYQQIKNTNYGNQEIARNIFLNLDKQMITQEFGNIKFKINQLGWHTNVQSWIDANVVNSLRGKIVSIKELREDPYEALSSIILHLVQSNVPIELNYDLIESFISKNLFIDKTPALDISKKEEKFISKYLEDLSSFYNFE